MSYRLASRPVSMLVLASGFLLGSADAPAQARAWDFRVYLDDSPIGHHRFDLREQDGERTLRTEARFNVKVLGFTAYRYLHDASEQWHSGCLSALTARTDDNGERLAVTAAAEGGRLGVTGPRGRTALEGCVMTFAYWDPAILRQQRLLNTQTGAYEAIKVDDLGQDKVLVRGVEVLATHYRLTGSRHPIDLWYSAQREWLALDSVVDGGRRLRYRLQ